MRYNSASFSDGDSLFFWCHLSGEFASIIKASEARNVIAIIIKIPVSIGSIFRCRISLAHRSPRGRHAT